MTLADVIAWFATLIFLSALLIWVIWIIQSKRGVAKKKRVQTVVGMCVGIVLLYGFWSISGI
jgi:hypothetical protein